MLSLKRVHNYFKIKYLPLYIRVRPRCTSKTSPVLCETLDKEREDFLEAWPGFVESLLKSRKITATSEISEWAKQIFDYNLIGCKLFRGLSVVCTYKNVEKPENLTEENLKLARTLGWCVELLEAKIVFQDDIMDEASLRYGFPCYHTLPEVGPRVVNDTTFLLMSMYQALKIHFGNHPCYQRMVQELSEGFYLYCLGQHLDYTTGRQVRYFTDQRYEDIVKYKVSSLFGLPATLALLLANIMDPEVHRKLESIFMQLGKLYQIRNDYLDLCGVEADTGKPDIRGGKCTWFAVQALNRSSGPQKVVFKTCYGSSQPADIERVENLYKQLKLKDLYHEEVEKIVKDIARQSKQLELSTGVPQRLVMQWEEMMEGRRK